MADKGSARTIEPSGVRYHGFDALRAWAMSMGIVLHAAWIMMPGEVGAPMTDVSASPVTEFIVLAIHTFRMQLFFVVAGLFACLLLRKRGLGKLALNRVQRIVLPLVAFWLILCPIMIWQYNAGGLASGAIQSEQSAWQLTRRYFANINADNVMLLHLWFIYYLCWVYVLVFAARGVASLVDPKRKIRDSISARFGDGLASPWSVLILAAVFALLMIPMKGSWGVDIGLAGLIPKWPGLLTYVGYFVVGWLIFRNIDRLNLFIRGWQWKLAVGLLLIVPYYFYSRYVSDHGYATRKYPQLVVADFHHQDGQPLYPEFRDELMAADADSIAAALWREIPEENRRFVEEHESVSENQLNGFLIAINRNALGGSEVSEQLNLDSMALSDEGRRLSQIPAVDRTVEQNQLLNRELINSEFAGIIYTEDVHRPYYYPIRIAYSFGYSLITWLLIFGCIGFSQNYFDRESRFWRYFSDSAYWFYLAHLPIQFQLLLWIGDEPWHWTIKFSTYVVATIAVLLTSYHLLVRPTWIGWFLNGRMTSVWGRSSGDAKIERTSVEQAVMGRSDLEHRKQRIDEASVSVEPRGEMNGPVGERVGQ
jgi:hypothetical protein